MFLGLLDPDLDPLVRGTDPDPDPSIIKPEKIRKTLIPSVLFYSLEEMSTILTFGKIV